MIQYDLRLQNDIHWDNMDRQFRRFIARHVNLHLSSVEIQGIVSNNNYTWFIMQGTPPLPQALTGMPRVPDSQGSDWKRNVGSIAGAVAVICVVVVVAAKYITRPH